MLAGEYSVLHGRPALVMAVDRRVCAWLEDSPRSLQGILAAVRDVMIEAHGPESPAADAAARVRVDSHALYDDHGIKLGLGSSAATCVAATLCCMRAANAPTDPAHVHRLAHRAHQLAQSRRGHPGSGADVAAAALGGLIEFTPEPTVTAAPITPPRSVHLVFVWTGRPADTVHLVGGVAAAESASPERFDALHRDMHRAVTQLAHALRTDNGRAVVAALAAAGGVVAELGQAANLPLQTDVHHQLLELASHHEGTCKPSGAGGGDVAIAAFCADTDAAGFRRGLANMGMKPLNLHLDTQSALVLPGPPPKSSATHQPSP